MSDEATLSRLRDRLAAGRVQVEALMHAEKWAELADVARDLARMEREIALAGRAAPPVAGRRVTVRG
jgi:hypothetical protein